MVLGNGHFLDHSEKKWYSAENSLQGVWDNIAEEMSLEFVESGHPIFCATTLLSLRNLKSQGHGILSIYFTADYPTIEIIFRIIVNANHFIVTEQCTNVYKI